VPREAGEGLLGCEANNVKKPDAVKLTNCNNKNALKFSSPPKGCFEKVEAKNPPCNPSGGAADLLLKTQDFVAAVVYANSHAATPTPTTTPTPTATPPPSTVDFTLDPAEETAGWSRRDRPRCCSIPIRST
jgi:hypothetical protein